MIIRDKFIPLTEIPDEYEAYLYIVVFDHNKKMRYYIGYHVGKFDGTYKGSPKTNEVEFLRDMHKYTYKVYALEIGTHEEMIYEEKVMLDNVEENIFKEELYNESRGGGKELKNYNKVLDTLMDDLDVGNLPIVEVDKHEVHSWRTWQVRFEEEIKGKVAKILAEMNQTDGKWILDKKPGLVLEDFDGKGNHVRIGNYHTTEAGVKCKFIEKLKVVFIPKKIWSKLDDLEIKSLGLWDNPQDTNHRDSSDPKTEIVPHMADICQTKDITPDHPSIAKELKRNRFTDTAIRGLIIRIKNLLEKRTEIPPHLQKIVYTSEELQALCEKHRTSDTHCIAVSSGYFNFDDFVEHLIEIDKPNWRIIIHHTEKKHKDKWELDYQSWVKRTLEKLNKRLKNPISYEFDPLPFTEAKPLR